MKMNSFKAFAGMATVWAMLAAAGPATGAPSLCDKKAFCLVSIDGISQEKSEPADGLCYATAEAALDPNHPADQQCARKWPFVYPGDHVLVRVKRANLIHYAYDIAVAKEVLAVVIPVVGAGELGNTLQSGTQAPQTAAKASASDSSESPANQLKKMQTDYTKLVNDLFDVSSSSTGSMRKVNALTAQGNAVWKGVEGKFPDAYASAAKTYLDALHSSGRDDSAGYMRQIDGVISRALSRKKDAEALAASTDDEKIAKAAQDFVTNFNQVADEAATLRSSLERTELVVLRWLDIIEAYPQATLIKDFLVDRKSQSYTVTVTRKPLTQVAVALDPARADATGGQAAQEPKAATLATFAFEGHAWHRFNISLGLAELFARDTSQFTVTPVVEGTTVKHFVRESDDQELTTRPIALLGTYLRKVDNYDPDRRAALMFTLGTEISASPEVYMAGLAWDFPSGFGVGFGVMEYKKRRLADGWHLGEEIPAKADGSPVINTVPIRQKNALGAYLSATVRPSVFNAFWRARKGA